MINPQIAEQFDEIADMLDITGESVFRIRAYRRAAEVVRAYAQDLAEMHEKNDAEIDKIPGIGKELHAKIIEFITSGKIQMHEDLLKKLAPGILKILKVRGVGPRKAKMFFEQLDIDSVEKLKSAAESGTLAGLPGMGEKSEKAILASLAQSTFLQTRIPLYIAVPQAEAYVEYMKKCSDVKKVAYAGSTRRRVDTVGDLDILAVGKNAEKMSEHFTKFPGVKQVLAKGETGSRVIVEGNLQVDFRVVKEESFGSALYYFTGSKLHNIKTRTIALKKNLKINEYGIFKGEKNIASKTEEDIFKAIGLPYIPPEIREDQGEIEAGLKNELPVLIEEQDLKGDLHLHTTWSDGGNSIYEMAIQAEEMGLEYIAITDHSRDLKMVLDEAKEIEDVRQKLHADGKKLKILHGAEIDILKNGVLNLPEEAINKLDIVLASVHSAFSLSKEEQTERIISALRQPKVNIFCHPSTRLINEREPIDVDFEKIIKVAKGNKVVLEIDGQSRRMDMNGALARLCKNNGLKVSIDSDSHSAEQMKNRKFGIFMAKRGWIEKDDVINTLSYNELLKVLNK